ncbi:uncharacterized protein [Nicotiana sylvestris]|uniref:uncharacterized protein n=1 Tax=Nicotiana sylvestris TaxID=4096 RepID=UPI00388C3C26
MRGAGRKDELLMVYFSQSLSGSALEWYTWQDHERWYTWEDLAQPFACHFQYNLEIIPDRLSLTKLEKTHNESFREYGFRWREQAVRVDPPIKEITFSDDELPVEGTEHNRALYLTVKYEDFVVTRVLVDNGSSANIFPLSTLNKLKVDDERILKNSICVQGLDGGGKDSVGDIVLELTIGPVEFTIEFQVLDVAVSYNLLLGRPWIHATKAVSSTLHQMVNFEWDRQKIVVYGEDNLCVPSDAIGLGASLQGIVQPVSLLKNMDTFGLGFKHTVADVKRARKLKQRVWVLPKPIPRLSRSFVRHGAKKYPATTVPSFVVGPDKEFLERFEKLFDEVNMVEAGEGSSKADVHFVGPSANINNWEVTHLPTRKEFWVVIQILCSVHLDILMDEEDTEKTAFITPWGIYCYMVMPFGLKNVGATYMRAMTTIFHDMIHKEIEVYVDDVIIKSRK